MKCWISRREKRRRARKAYYGYFGDAHLRWGNRLDRKRSKRNPRYFLVNIEHVEAMRASGVTIIEKTYTKAQL
jgi:hypothetical protein